ncbi:hypothetical protein JTB14_013525, partial [Gonioctena quinquepunctata]
NRNYRNNQRRETYSDEEQSIIEEVNQDESEVILSNQQDILEKNDSFNSKQGQQKRTQNHVTLEDVNKSAFEYFEKKKQAPYRPPTSANDNIDVQFLLSLLPDLKKMTDKKKRKYKVEF